MLDPLWDFDKLSDQFYKYSGCKKNEMWGKNCYTSCGAQTNFDNFINTAGIRRMICGVKALLDPLWDLNKF